MRTANIVAATMDFMDRRRVRDVRLERRIRRFREDRVVERVDRIVDRRVPTHRSASLERTVKMERTQGEIRPVSIVLLESSRHRLVRPPLFI